ncbi:TPA: hypothetical protein SMO99_002943 [Proteus mirabilis]|uniref:Uncharacterized protein n=1 Tax=Morganella morganii TaxID=582 RepID=A0AAI9MUI9_MORMO|nr:MULTISPECIES: hypothetical protein [Providencia]EKW8762738.1 hypothetical protein [Morganella morganii]HEJ9425153.1 hypothetical protein [Proteus mirabilis]THB24665.1 hypothetical protein E6R27_16810 [Providencia sp. MGF014]TNU98896.1 hypothetical protein FH869_18390 [Providencia rettgeri]WOB88695.1 hypothetical protein P3L40_22510 [Providencia sp. PROV040]
MSRAPQSEIQAISLFKQLGRKAVEARFNELSRLAQARLDESYRIHGTIPVGFTALNFMTNDERTERHQLLLAIQLCTDPQAEAHARIMDRRAAMKRGIHAVTVG